MVTNYNYGTGAITPQEERIEDSDVLRSFMDQLGIERDEEVEQALDSDSIYMIADLKCIDEHSDLRGDPFSPGSSLSIEADYRILNEDEEILQRGVKGYTAESLRAHHPDIIAEDGFYPAAENSRSDDISQPQAEPMD